MIRFLRRQTLEKVQQIFRQPSEKRGARILSSRQGQVGLVLILLAALGLVFYAMSLNLNKVSSTKNKTMIGAQKSAGFMASFMASYGQKMSQEQLKGKLKYCKKTNVFKRLLTLIVIVVLVVAFGQYYMAAYIAIAMAAAAVAIEVAVIQPGITNMWNKMMKDTLTPQGQLIEYGIQYGLFSAVDDAVTFPDLIDADMDGVFGTIDLNKPMTGSWMDVMEWTGGVPDYLSRSAYYYTKRLQQLPQPDTAPLDEFVKQLEDFVYYFDYPKDAAGNSEDIWGITDSYYKNQSFRETSPFPTILHNCTASLTSPAECDPSCVPAREPCCEYDQCRDGEGNPNWDDCTATWPAGEISSDPECCWSCRYPSAGDPDPSCEFALVEGSNSGCGAKSFIGDQPSPSPNQYPLVFDPFYEDTTNDIFSLRELIGRDDESPLYTVNPENADWHTDAKTDPLTHQVLRITAPDLTKGTTETPADWYKIQDTTGFYKSDSQRGIYPLLYTIQDVGVSWATIDKINAESLASGGSEYSRFLCYWKQWACSTNPGDENYNMGAYADANRNGTQLSELNLGPFDPVSGGDEVMDLGAGGRPDNVADPFFNEPLLISDDTCAYNLNSDGTLSKKTRGWKRGSDQFCSTEFPYNVECAKHGVCTDKATDDGGDTVNEDRDCYCGETNAWDNMFFTEDPLEDIYYGITDFMVWAQAFIAQYSEESMGPFMTKSVSEWYDQANEWIGPGGKLADFRADLTWYYNVFNNWIYPAQADAYVGKSTSCIGASETTWCMPAQDTNVNEHGQTECPGVTAEEAATFNVNSADADSLGRDVRGDLEDVVACLDWNVNDSNTFLNRSEGTVIAAGNQEKFQACADHCGPWACKEMARSLVFDSAIQQARLDDLDNHWSDKEKYIYCLNSRSYAECDARCEPGPLPMFNAVTAAPYPIDSTKYKAPELAKIGAVEEVESRWEDACLVPLASFNETIYCDTYTATIGSCDSADYLYEKDKIEACKDSLGGTCTNFLTQTSGDYYDEAVLLADNVLINGEADDTTGFCNDPSFRDWVDKSADAAENLVLKLDQRYKLLKYVLDEGKEARRIFGMAADRFSEFLDNNTPYGIAYGTNETTLGSDSGSGYINPDRERIVKWSQGVEMNNGQNVYQKYDIDSPAEIVEAMHRDDANGAGDLPSVVVYVWRGPEPEEPRDINPGIGGGAPQLEKLGYVHAVKVEVRAPLRCNDRCSLDGKSRQRWPWIKTKTKGFLKSKRCFYLKDYQGRVKARVIRYDEPIDNTTSAFRFANNVPIWGMRTSHPDSGPGSPAGIFDQRGPCFSQIDPMLAETGMMFNQGDFPRNGAPQNVHHAFMLNKKPWSGAGDDYDSCWERVHENLLEHGVHSESCAAYVWEGDDMGVRFVDCDDEFSKGTK